ncbi:MAG: hypothetical protein ABEJ76_09320 [Halanaeroarchaeum sp.]
MKSLRGLSLLSEVLGAGEGEEPPYVCRECGAALSVQYHSCPKCGSYNVDRRTWDDE